MSRRGEMLIRSMARTGRLIPKRTGGLRAGTVVLPPQGAMPWHSTRTHEELLLVLDGEVELQIRARGRVTRAPLRAGRCALLPAQTAHQLINRSAAQARYVYVTAPAATRKT